MFSSLKKLFGTRPRATVETESAADVAPGAPPRIPATVASARRDARAAHTVVSSTTSPTMAIPLGSILSRLPADLLQRVRQMDVGTAEFFIPTQKVLTQIALGAVKISFGELRQAAPPGVFTAQSDRDRTLIEIPLGEIVARLDPSLMLRRAAQRQVVVPPEVAGPFGNACTPAGVAFSTSTTIKDAVAAQPVAPLPTVEIPRVTPPPVARIHVAAATKITAAPAVPPVTAQANHVNQVAESPVFSRKPAAPAVPVASVNLQPLPAPVIPPAVPAVKTSSGTSFWTAPIATPAAETSAAAPLQHPFFHTPISTAPIAPAVPITPLAPEPEAAPAPIAFNAAASPITQSARAAKPLVPITPVAPQAEASPEPIRFNAFPPAKPSLPPEPVETRFLTVALTQAAQDWPEEVQKEIAAFKLSAAVLELPFGKIESAIKQGRIHFPWSLVRTWIKPPVGVGTTVNDEVILEFSLKLITPLFLAELKATKPAQRKVAIDASIPDLFSGGALPKAEAPAAKVETFARPAPAPVALPPVPPASVAPVPNPPFNSISKALPTPVAPVPPKPADTNYYAKPVSGVPVEEVAPVVKKGPSPGTDFLNRYATPTEIVNKAAALEGVDGALIALPDGLLVASNIAPTMNADTIAAFLPQIFGRVVQSTKELRMGDLNNLNFTVGGIPWKIFKVGAIYFAAFGRPGQALPTAQLVEIAAELDRKAK